MKRWRLSFCDGTQPGFQWTVFFLYIFYWMYKQAVFSPLHVFYWLALNLTARTGTVGVCQLLLGTTVQFWCQAFVCLVLPTCLDHAWGTQYTVWTMVYRINLLFYTVTMDLSRNVHMNRLYWKAYKTCQRIWYTEYYFFLLFHSFYTRLCCNNWLSLLLAS